MISCIYLHDLGVYVRVWLLTEKIGDHVGRGFCFGHERILYHLEPRARDGFIVINISHIVIHIAIADSFILPSELYSNIIPKLPCNQYINHLT